MGKGPEKAMKRAGEGSQMFRLLHLCIVALFFLSGTADVFGAETPGIPEPGIKRAAIRKPLGQAHGLSAAKTEAAFPVEVVRDMEGLKKGLSFRESLPEDHGMLFVLDASQDHAFWMKGMRFPLDIIFLGGDMQIIEILEDLQPCRPSNECPLYFPKERPAYALEINAGLARKHGLSIGDSLVIERYDQ